MLSKLEQFIKEADHIPSIPSQMTHLLQTIGDPRSSASELERLITPDATLSARLLRLSNSAFYYRMQPVTRIADALTRLGFKTTRSLVVTVWTQSIRTFMNDQDELEIMSQMLNHGTACAVIAKALLGRINRHLAEDAFLAGLLHDMGRLALTCQYGSRYKNDIIVFSEKTARDLSSVEEQVLGFDHAVLGARLLDAWHLPALYRETAGGHHIATVAPATNPILASVILADSWATDLGYNVALNSFRPRRDDIQSFFRLDDIPAFKKDCEERINSMIEALTE